MSTPGEPTAKALLGELLRLARLDSEYKTQGELARAVGLERTGITRAEGGEHPPTLQVLNEILAQTGPHSRLCEAAVRGVWRLARHEGDGDEPVKIWFSGYLPVEATALVIRTWHPVIIPGLLQTEAYGRALFAAMGMTEEQVNEQLALRKQRQQILTREHPPSIIIVLWEPVLHHQIGTPETMREQLGRLLELPSNVVVQVVPGDIGGNAGLGGAVTVAEGPQGTVLLAEALIEDQVSVDADLVRAGSSTFDAVRADAVSRSQSRSMITEAQESWNNR